MVDDYSLIIFTKHYNRIARLSRELGFYKGQSFIHLSMNPAPNIENIRNPWSDSLHEGISSFTHDVIILALLDAAKADEFVTEVRILPSSFVIEHDICGTIICNSVLRPEGAEMGNAIMIQSEYDIVPTEIRELILMISKIKLVDVCDTLRSEFLSYVIFHEKSSKNSDEPRGEVAWDVVRDFIERATSGLIGRIFNSRNENDQVRISDRYSGRNSGKQKSIGHKRRARR